MNVLEIEAMTTFCRLLYEMAYTLGAFAIGSCMLTLFKRIYSKEEMKLVSLHNAMTFDIGASQGIFSEESNSSSI